METEENKEENPKKEKKKINLTEKIRENPWILSTLVLGILIIILLISNFSGGVTGKVTANEARERFLSYIGAQGADVDDIEITDVHSKSGLYEISFNYKGEPYPIPYYLTKDAKFIGMMDELVLSSFESNSQTTTEIPKSDKPKVELFVMSHCPYGTQAEKGIIPVVELLGNKIDFHIRFVYYAMHPSYGEVEEQLNQYCIQEEQKDKYLNYLKCFLEDGDGEGCLNKAGIDKNKLSSCVLRVDKQFNVTKNLNDESLWLNGRYPLFKIHEDLNEKYGIRGSPTLVINGEVVSSGRSPADYLNVICQAFNDDKVPETCSTKLSSSSYSPGFGYSSSESTSTTAQCG